MNNRDEELVSSLEELLYEGNRPDLSLGQTGELPPEWEDQYLALLTENRNYWQNLDNWPRPLFYCFYRVGFHFTMAYTGWCEKNEKNLQLKYRCNALEFLRKHSL